MAEMHHNFLIVHGTLGSPESNWYLWLKRELEAAGHTVLVPHFPTPEGQSFASWWGIAEEALKNFDPANTILIGHSMGAVFALSLAEKAKKAFRAIYIVSPFMRTLGIEPYDTLNATFIGKSFDWPKIIQNAGKVFCFAGKDDPYVLLAYAKEVADFAGATLTVVEKGGHLNAESGYREFPLLLDKIRQTDGA